MKCITGDNGDTRESAAEAVRAAADRHAAKVLPIIREAQKVHR